MYYLKGMLKQLQRSRFCRQNDYFEHAPTYLNNISFSVSSIYINIISMNLYIEIYRLGKSLLGVVVR